MLSFLGLDVVRVRVRLGKGKERKGTLYLLLVVSVYEYAWLLGVSGAWTQVPRTSTCPKVLEKAQHGAVQERRDIKQLPTYPYPSIPVLP